MIKDLTNDSISQQVRARNRAEFNKLFRSNYHQLCNYACTYLFDLSVAKDMVQDVFVQIWNRSERFPEMNDSAVKSYLYTAVRNKCLDYLKKLKTKDQYEFEILKQARISESGDSKMDSIELEGILQHSIAEMSSTHQKILEYKAQGLKNKEVSSKLSLSVRTLEWHTLTIRKKIKEIIKNYIS